ncbi:UNVERIFIED_CONTAM: Retrovirus-related Pol polyprotein from transposon RE1 [Sesamum angustifolium]|uniref:Retrovirus-related Pol polyprotein from transposon RE1 n=1 Tax=Sesamum angustifolium TaxID=2727405 RepID=A0AAW2NZT4_9LAMI
MVSSSNQIPAAATAVNESGNTRAMRIQTVEVPGMIMISAPPNGNNWLSWSRSVRIALEGRDKLGFIDGSCVTPVTGTPQHKQWRIADCVVRTWILNTISKDIVNAFLTGHNKDSCFKLHGIPEWYKDLNEQRRKQGISGRAYIAAETEQKSGDKLDVAGNNLVSDLLEALRIMQNKIPTDPLSVNFVQEMDLRTKQLLALGKQIRNLYILEPSSFTFVPQHSPHSSTPESTPSSMHDTISDDLIHSPVIHPPNPVVPLRRSHKQSHHPPWLNDFICPSATSPLDSYTLTPSYCAFLVAFSTVQEPRSYKQAKGCPEWEEAMRQELQALENNELWAVVDLPPGTEPIGIAKSVTVRILLVVASASNWVLHQVDINNAFLHGYLNEDIYMTPPDGYSVSVGKSAHDHCLFVKNTAAGLLVLLTYVDDLLIASPSESLIIEVKKFLHDAFSIKDLGLARYFLGLEIARSADGTSVSQHKYIRDIVQDTGLLHSRPTSTPLPLGFKLTSQGDVVLADPEPYRRLVGRLLYLSFTRPDICYGVQQLSQFVHRPCHSHMDAAFHLVRYLKGCQDKGLFIPASNSSVLTGYCDADWASCTDSRRSLTGYSVFLGNALISW